MNNAMIEARDLTYRYETGLSDAVAGVTFRIERGEFVAILGRNGCGKSTLAKLMNALLLPTSGTITVDGMTAHDENDCYDIRRACGMVFQNPDNQIVTTIVEEDCAFGLENLGVEPKLIRQRVDESLKAVGMGEYAHASPAMLSGGQKQRVAVAGVYAMRPKIIVFDESTAMLDPSGRREVLDSIRMLNRDFGITVLNITHYMNEAALADRVLVINDGMLLLDGTPDEIFAQQALLEKVGLEVPQCAELIYALQKAGVKVEGEALSTPEGCAEMILHAYRNKGGLSHE